MEANAPQATPPSEPAKPESAVGEKPNGPVAAAVLAAGLGALALAVVTVWAEASEGFKESIKYDDGVGPLSGKTIWATVVYLVSWLGLGLGLRNMNLDLKKVTVVTGVLLALGFIGTFSEFFLLFEAD